ncbi:MAG: hypothetical protein WCA46_01010 [Actinocatenispora sp.]
MTGAGTPWHRWRTGRARRRFQEIDDRLWRADALAEQGRWQELAVELGEIAREYAGQTLIRDHTRSALVARIRRCDALVRAGLVAQARTEQSWLLDLLREAEGPDGELAARLRRDVAIALRETGAEGG